MPLARPLVRPIECGFVEPSVRRAYSVLVEKSVVLGFVLHMFDPHHHSKTWDRSTEFGDRYCPFAPSLPLGNRQSLLIEALES